MGFTVFMFVCNLLIPLVMIIAGYMMYKHTPKEINGIFGYRTKRSMKNEETWHFAHEVCGKMWIKLGIALLILSLSVQLIFLHSDNDTFGNISLILETADVILLLLSIIPVEKSLKTTFDEDGNRNDF